MTEKTVFIVLCVLAVLVALLCVLVLFVLAGGIRDRKQLLADYEELRSLMGDTADDITERVGTRVADIQDDISRRLSHDSEENRKNRVEVSDMIRQGNDAQLRAVERFSERQQGLLAELRENQERRLSEFSEKQGTKLSEISERQSAGMKEQTQDVQRALSESLKTLTDSNREKLSEIQGEINKKLDTSLNERLDESFKNVSDQLAKLYQSLGELGKLEDGVVSLNRTLSNVKTRGILGESQLENILAGILTNTLYDRNVETKKGSHEVVEFAVKIPDKEVTGSFMYLPIDSKFPTSIYDRICDAAEKGEAEALQRAQKELEQRIKTEARTIRDKYVDPPATTDFAIMFLPTESLYAEVLRIPGLSEECQRKHHIVITGPTTIAALLNSLSIGFRYMAVNRDSQNILKLLSAIKTQYGTLSALIDTAGNRIDLAKKATTDLQHRADLINKRLSAVEEIDQKEAQELLGLREEAKGES